MREPDATALTGVEEDVPEAAGVPGVRRVVGRGVMRSTSNMRVLRRVAVGNVVLASAGRALCSSILETCGAGKRITRDSFMATNSPSISPTFA